MKHLEDKFSGIAFMAIALGSAVGGALVQNTDEYATRMNISVSSAVQARQARVTAETSCTEQEKMFKKLGQYFDKLSSDVAGNPNLAVKNPDFTITKQECLKLMQERQQRATTAPTL